MSATAAKSKPIADPETSVKIKNAARKLFSQRGYSGVTTRDIAAEAGINVALLHYYFRSKELLFEMIIVEGLTTFMQGIKQIVTDDAISLELKFEALTDRYISMLTEYPDLPLFFLSEIQANPDLLDSKLGHVFADIRKSIRHSSFIDQIRETLEANKILQVHVAHILANFIGLTVFPFVARPLIQKIANVSDKQFAAMMSERRVLIPFWMKSIMQTAPSALRVGK